jgi:hypothetical protein
MDMSMMMSGSRPALHAFLVNTNTEMARARIVRPIHSPRTALPQSANNVRWALSPRWISPARPVSSARLVDMAAKGNVELALQDLHATTLLFLITAVDASQGFTRKI